MSAGDPPLLSALARRLEFLAARTGVVAENIANADTPDYAAKDVIQPSFARRLAVALKTSDARHIAAPPSAPSGIRAVSAPDDDAALNGNRVSVETQMIKLAETRGDYQLAASVYRKALEMIRFAARGGR